MQCDACGRWIGQKNYLCDRDGDNIFVCSLGHETVLYLPTIWAKDFLSIVNKVHVDRDYAKEMATAGRMPFNSVIR